jgi:cytochrome c551/c552
VTIPGVRPLLLAALALGAGGAWPGAAPVAGASDPATGEAVAAAKGCGTCHALPGEGGRAKPGPGFLSPAPPRPGPEIVRSLWNHVPDMRRHVIARALAWPAMGNDEMEALLAFLGRTPSLERVPDPERGRRLLVERGCLTCHALDTAGGRTASDLAALRGLGDLAALAVALWNQAPVMADALEQRGVPYPLFQPGEMADLLESLRGPGHATR